MNISEESFWISQFCSRAGNDFFCKVDTEFFRNRSNLEIFQNLNCDYFRPALSLILGEPREPRQNLGENEEELIEVTARRIYGVMHSLFIRTLRGMEKMIVKYQNGDFGYCRRVKCQSQKMLPMGLSDTPGVGPVKLYCPKCRDAYNAGSAGYSYLDGAYFGTKFPQTVFTHFPELLPENFSGRFIPTLYGFGVQSLPN